MSVQIPGIPQAATGVALTNAVNDRLRRISEQLGTTAAATAATAQGPQGIPGPSGSSSGIFPAAFTIGVSGGAAKPDLSRSPVQQVVLAADTNLVVPANRPASQTMIWQLFVDNPSGTPWSLIPDSSYGVSVAIVVNAGTRSILQCATTQSGNTMVSSVASNLAILPL